MSCIKYFGPLAMLFGPYWAAADLAPVNSSALPGIRALEGVVGLITSTSGGLHQDPRFNTPCSSVNLSADGRFLTALHCFLATNLLESSMMPIQVNSHHIGISNFTFLESYASDFRNRFGQTVFGIQAIRAGSRFPFLPAADSLDGRPSLLRVSMARQEDLVLGRLVLTGGRAASTFPPHVTLRDTDVEPSEPLFAVGYPTALARDPRTIADRILPGMPYFSEGRLSDLPRGMPSYVSVSTNDVVAGMSGGGVFDASGRLVGILIRSASTPNRNFGRAFWLNHRILAPMLNGRRIPTH